ncbi:hypothetical protein [Sulfurimonas sp.]
MERFFELEIAYIVIGIFFLVVTAFVTTRDFMPKGAFKKGMLGIFTIFAIMISIHYYITTKRMSGVKEIFNEGKTIICENKMRRTISQSVLISKKLGWKLEGDYFKNPDFIRDFHTARCVDYSPIAPKDEKHDEK